MKKSDIPQDESNFKDLYYAVDDQGNYTTATSTGWDPKIIALDNAMQDIHERTENAKRRVLSGETSPLEYHMEKNKMDVPLLSSYVGFWKWRVKRHFKPSVFKKLSSKIIKKYADVFDIGIEELKDITK